MPYYLTPLGEAVRESGHQAGFKLEVYGFGDNDGVMDEIEGFPEVYEREGY